MIADGRAGLLAVGDRRARPAIKERVVQNCHLPQQVFPDALHFRVHLNQRINRMGRKARPIILLNQVTAGHASGPIAEALRSACDLPHAGRAKNHMAAATPWSAPLNKMFLCHRDQFFNTPTGLVLTHLTKILVRGPSRYDTAHGITFVISLPALRECLIALKKIDAVCLPERGHPGHHAIALDFPSVDTTDAGTGGA